MPFIWPVRVRFVDTDASGRIHFTAMLRHFEAAEIEFMRSLGLPQREAAVSLPRVHVECTYTAMVRYDDLLEISVRVEKIGNASYKLGFEARVGDNLVARGFVTAVCVDVNTGRSRALPAILAEALKRAQAESDAAKAG